MSTVEICIIVLGRGGVGKTALVQRISQGTFRSNYTPTTALAYDQHRMSTTRGDVQFTFCDGPWNDMRISAGDGFMVIFDLTCLESVEEAKNFVKGLPDAKPVALIGNKADLPFGEPIAITEAINGIDHPKLRYDEISVRLGYNIVEPLLWITQQVLADPRLIFVEGVAPSGPRVYLDPDAAPGP